MLWHTAAGGRKKELQKASEAWQESRNYNFPSGPPPPQLKENTKGQKPRPWRCKAPEGLHLRRWASQAAGTTRTPLNGLKSRTETATLPPASV